MWGSCTGRTLIDQAGRGGIWSGGACSPGISASIPVRYELQDDDAVVPRHTGCIHGIKGRIQPRPARFERHAIDDYQQKQ